MESYDRLIEKWAPVLDNEAAGSINDAHRKALLLKNVRNSQVSFQKLLLLTLQHRLITGIQFLSLLFVVQCLT